ncbi:MAG TPA: aspartate-alanine antiporter [Casimicrobiaceae bacterium]|nr:aspartate-alanine antiporter [Casimicrobiaceae bacterium]
MWAWFVDVLRSHPEMAVFLTLAFGYWIGKIKLGTIPLGAVVGVLIAGVVIGQAGVKPSADLKTVFFLLFLFSIGYRTGPQFFNGLKSSGLPQIALTVIFCVTALAIAYVAARIAAYDAGTAGGLLAGGTTESATIGTATDAINRLPIEAGSKQSLIANAAVAFAVTYFLGVLSTVTFLARFGPHILGVDLAAECAKLEQQMGLAADDAIVTGYRPFTVRALRVEGDGYAGKTAREIEAAFAARGQRLFVARIRQGDRIAVATPDMLIPKGAVVALAARRQVLLGEQTAIGPEVDDKALLDFPIDTVDAVITDKALGGVTVRELTGHLGPESLRGVGVRKITRGGAELPLTAETRLARGDVITLAGMPEAVAHVAATIGYADRPTNATEVALVAAAVFLGGLIGIPAFRAHGLEIGLSQSVGVLIGGLVLGWLRSVDRRIPKLPEAAVWLFDSMGLTTFLAVTALTAGPDFVKGLQQSGLSLVVAGLILVIIPQLVTLLAGKYIFHMHPGILLGVCCGAGTSAPSLAAVQDVAKSKVPTLGYGVTYAVGNVLLALWGSVIVALVH